MKRLRAFVVVAMATASLNLAAIAQTTTGSPKTSAAPQISTPSEPILSTSQRAAIARDLVAKWRSAANSRPGGGGERWSRILTKAVMAAGGENVLKATTARTVDEVPIALTGGDFANPVAAEKQLIGNGEVSPQTLGSYSSDLVYTPLPYGRCRIADSRVISSPLVGTRSLYIENTANYTSQGGNGTYASGTGSTNCGINYYTRAYAMSITLLSAASPGIFKVFQYGQPFQTGNSVTATPGALSGSADVIVTSCQGCAFDISINSSASVHYVIDIVGYYMPPQRTALSCYRTDEIASQLSSGFSGNFPAPECSPGYTRVSVDCFAQYLPTTLHQWRGGCQAYNFSGATANITRASVCCSVPGR